MCSLNDCEWMLYMRALSSEKVYNALFGIIPVCFEYNPIIQMLKHTFTTVTMES